MAAPSPTIGMHSRISTDHNPLRPGWTSLFDAQRLAARTGQQGTTLRDFATLLLDHLPHDLGALRDALQGREAARIAIAAHKLAGTFAALAIDPLVSESVAIEEAASVRDFSHCIALANRLQARCEQVVEELARFVATFEAP